MKIKDNFVEEFNKLTGNTIDLDGLDGFLGTYHLYRPCLRKPNEQFLASILTIGSDDSNFDCKMETCYVDEFDFTQEEVVLGKIIPTFTDAMCVLTAPKARSSFTIHFHTIKRANNDYGEIRFMSGIMLAASSDGQSTASPVFAQAIELDRMQMTPFTVSATAFLELPPIVREALSRGIVHSDKEFYPGPPIRKDLLGPQI